MSVKRNKDGTITIKSDNEVSSIGRIGFSTKEDTEFKAKYQNWIEECAKTVHVCSHTIEETEQFFLGQCEALPIAIDDRRIKSFQYSVVMNYFMDKIGHKSPESIFDMTDDEIEKWHKEQNEIHREIMSFSPDHYGLYISGYYLPHTERNLPFYEEADNDFNKMTKHFKKNKTHKQVQDICVFFEKTTGHVECSGGGRSLFEHIIVYRGVEEEDIRLRNTRFLGYITSMRELGYLPDFRKQ